MCLSLAHTSISTKHACRQAWTLYPYAWDSHKETQEEGRGTRQQQKREEGFLLPDLEETVFLHFFSAAKIYILN